MPKKVVTPPPKEKPLDEIETEALELSLTSLEEQAKRELSGMLLKAVKKIAYYLSKVGLSLDEACMLVDIDVDKFREEIKLHPIISKIIRMKELEYKKDLLYTLSSKARSGDDKLATWLLERRHPEEFGDKKAKPDSGTHDLVLEAIKFIQGNGDNNPLVNPAAGSVTALRITSKAPTSKVPAEDIMNGLVPPTQSKS